VKQPPGVEERQEQQSEAEFGASSLVLKIVILFHK